MFFKLFAIIIQFYYARIKCQSFPHTISQNKSISIYQNTKNLKKISHYTLHDDKMVTELTDENFHEFLEKSDKPVLVDFWAEWCPPCKILKSTFKNLSEKLTDFEFAKLDIEKNQKITEEFKITSIPTIIFYKKGKAIHKVIGNMDEEELEKEIVNTFSKN